MFVVRQGPMDIQRHAKIGNPAIYRGLCSLCKRNFCDALLPDVRWRAM
jgi:hypothetical protein